MKGLCSPPSSPSSSFSVPPRALSLYLSLSLNFARTKFHVTRFYIARTGAFKSHFRQCTRVRCVFVIKVTGAARTKAEGRNLPYTDIRTEILFRVNSIMTAVIRYRISHSGSRSLIIAHTENARSNDRIAFRNVSECSVRGDLTAGLILARRRKFLRISKVYI